MAVSREAKTGSDVQELEEDFTMSSNEELLLKKIADTLDEMLGCLVSDRQVGTSHASLVSAFDRSRT